MAGNKHGDDGKEVVGELLGAQDWLSTLNHEPSARFLEEELQELEAVATQSVFVPNHNFCDHSAVDSFQKPL